MEKRTFSIKSETHRYSKVGDFLIEVEEAIDSTDPKGKLKRIAQKYKMKLEDLKPAVDTVVTFDSKKYRYPDKIMKKCGFCDTKSFASKGFKYGIFKFVGLPGDDDPWAAQPTWVKTFKEKPSHEEVLKWFKEKTGKNRSKYDILIFNNYENKWTQEPYM